MTDALRYAEALAAKFTGPIPRCDKSGENEWLENPEPADRVGQSLRVSFIADDGDRAFRMVTCMEAAEVVAAVRDEELRRLRHEVEQWHAAYGEKALPVTLARLHAAEAKVRDYENAIARARLLHPTGAELVAAHAECDTLCPTCIYPAPCPTRRALDGQE